MEEKNNLPDDVHDNISSSSELDSAEFLSCASSEGGLQLDGLRDDGLETGRSPAPDDDEEDDDDDDTTTLLEQVLFFGCGVGSSLCYIATLSSLVYFKILYGPDSFVDLNLAIYLPLLPISLAQARWDQYYDQQYRSRRTFVVRGMVGFGLSLLGTLQMIHHSMSLQSLIGNALLQGIGGAILYGTLNQMASFVGRGEQTTNRLKATVSAGVQASALVVLAVSLATGFGTEHSADNFPLFLWSIVLLEGMFFAMFLWLLLARPSVAASMSRRDSSIRYSMMMPEEVIGGLSDDDDDDDDANANLEAPLLLMESTPPLHRRLFPEDQQQPQARRRRRQQQQQQVGLSFWDLCKCTQACCVVLIVTLAPSFLVGSWFTRVQTDWIQLAQVLFYVKIGADFIGRLATIVLPPRNITCLTWTVTLRMIPVLLFFVNARGGLLFSNNSEYSDLLSIVLVAVIAFLSGYLVTGCFQLAPQGLPCDLRATNLAKQASLLTVAFSIAAIGGLLSSFTLIAIGL
jgi:hypothetical protein